MQSISELLNLGGRAAIVTGGAKGIGFGIAYRLAEAGASVLIADINPEVGGKAAKELSDAGFKSDFIKTDVSEETEVKAAVDFAERTFGSVDIMVNNAGIYPMIPAMKMAVEDFKKIMAVNVRSAFMFTKAVAEVMIKQKRGGKIINITSIDALHPSSVGLAVYDASKHALWGFTKNMALELAPHKIWVNAIAPGGIQTPGVEAMQSQIKMPAGADPKAMIEAFMAKIPMHRMGEPDEIGKVVLFLASDMASYMTGSQIVVDGGALLS
ncbi:TPA: SDR family oxidoreductase [Candidatus Saccharibacteria bacterium]|nr:SDR family oxidoreductase [Candidatus Saccharibacteria bacterium]